VQSYQQKFGIQCSETASRNPPKSSFCAKPRKS